MTTQLRGADIVARALQRLGCKRIFSLSGNHIMSIFDAVLDAGIEIVHVRHEAAAVHMADGYGRLTGETGVAMVTGGPGHANALGALFNALGAESPVLLLSGHAATWELGRHGFQELAQAEMAKPITKASWTATSTATLGRDMGDAIEIATSGRPGPVHVSLPSDLLEARIDESEVVWPRQNGRRPAALNDADAGAILAALSAAARPMIFGAAHFSRFAGRQLLSRLEAATGVPAVVLESPRGLTDSTLGAFPDVARRADLLLLVGKPLDFTVKWAAPPAFDADMRVIAIDPDQAMLDHARKEIGARLTGAFVADPFAAAESLLARAKSRTPQRTPWLGQARAGLDDRPAAWADLVSKTPGRLHPAEVCRVLLPYVQRDPDTVLICDGGEFAQWAQAMLPVRQRLINGVTGSIGAALCFAAAGRLVQPNAPVFAVLGDGTLGFHIGEFETAARHNLPFVAIIGNDGRWNAEVQIQRREYGQNRVHSCDLLPARYDQVAIGLGGYGELVEDVRDLSGAIERALASGKPACINIMTESVPAPALRLDT